MPWEEETRPGNMPSDLVFYWWREAESNRRRQDFQSYKGVFLLFFTSFSSSLLFPILRINKPKMEGLFSFFLFLPLSCCVPFFQRISNALEDRS